MKLTITINTGNDALLDFDEVALSQTLRDLARNIATEGLDDGPSGCRFVIRDTNGNKVGEATYA